MNNIPIYCFEHIIEHCKEDIVSKETQIQIEDQIIKYELSFLTSHFAKNTIEYKMDISSLYPLGDAYLSGEISFDGKILDAHISRMASNGSCERKGFPSAMFEQLTVILFQIAKEEEYKKEQIQIHGWLSTGETQNWTSSIPFYIKATAGTFDFVIYDKKTGEKELFVPAAMNLSHEERAALAADFRRKYSDREHTFLFTRPS